ncbi:hypothetical protein Ais01nite_81150 [Asanoa ishikariensis]|uniref:Uncharacterized protein n=1 Tax=Asanoa ishikariensis TaxID=137265 RepID=A0A1H3UYF7_9ACTN|nr:hypothetical protein [Asanoa ishikariensis]GIF70080.1 hypothetical protein Ais01nite_81150 [Asanoa ishikariensis]SDZ67482.1 hypothetical protein SAMN05421684_8457 [Asanoa ishikariensis]
MLATVVRRWAVVAVALPLAAAGIRKVSQVVEARRGPSGVTRSMRQFADLLGMGRRKRRRFF